MGRLRAGPRAPSRRYQIAELDGEAQRALEAATATEDRREHFAATLDEWEGETPDTIVYQPFEAYPIRRSIGGRPATFHVMDLRPDNLVFGR